MEKDQKYSILVSWTKGELTKSEFANNHPLTLSEANLLLQKVKKTVFPPGTTATFEIVEQSEENCI